MSGFITDSPLQRINEKSRVDCTAPYPDKTGVICAESRHVCYSYNEGEEADRLTSLPMYR